MILKILMMMKKMMTVLSYCFLMTLKQMIRMSFSMNWIWTLRLEHFSVKMTWKLNLMSCSSMMIPKVKPKSFSVMMISKEQQPHYSDSVMKTLMVQLSFSVLMTIQFLLPASSSGLPKRIWLPGQHHFLSFLRKSSMRRLPSCCVRVLMISLLMNLILPMIC